MRRLGTILGFGCVLWALGHTSPALAGEVVVPVGPNAGMTVSVPVRSVKEIREDGITLQRLDYSCGSAALATLFTSYLEQPYSESEIIDFILKRTDVQKVVVRRGFSLLDLKTFAEAHGVTATGYQLEYSGLLELHCPVLVPLYHQENGLRHFVIFRGAMEDRVFLADPAAGRQTMFRAEFDQLWSPKVGMVFSHPGMPPAAQTPLGLKPDEELYFASDTLRTILLQTATQYIHSAKEF